MGDEILLKAAELSRAGRPFVLATVVLAERPAAARPGAKALLTADGALVGWVGGSCAQPLVAREALAALQDGQPRLLRLSPEVGQRSRPGVREYLMTCQSGGTLEIYLEPFLPRPTLALVGQSPVIATLAELGGRFGFQVAVFDPDGTPERYPTADAVHARLDLVEMGVGPDSFVVVASMGTYDEEAVERALATGASYVALVASRRRAATLREVLAQRGVPADQLARLRAPAGLDLRAETPAEIALSILAEIVLVRRSAAGVPQLGREPAPRLREAVDPVCGMVVDPSSARQRSVYRGLTVYFCCPACKARFEAGPEAYAARLSGPSGAEAEAVRLGAGRLSAPPDV